MPLNYLEGSPQDVYAIQRAGSTFSDAVIGMQRERLAQQRFMQDMALRAQQMANERDQANQRLMLERERIGNESKLNTAQINRENAQTQSLRNQDQAGGMLGDVLKAQYETDPQKNPDVTNFLRALAAQQQGRIAATSPATIARQSAQIAASRDPKVQQLIATDTPMIQPVPAGGALVNNMTGQKLFQNDPRITLRDPEALANERLSALIRGYGDLTRDNVTSTDPIMQNVNSQLMDALINKKGKVKVRRNDGAIGYIPNEQLQDALGQGYTQVE